MTAAGDAMYLLAKEAGAGVDDIADLPVLAVGRCGKREKDRLCRHPVAYLYATRLGPLLVAIVPNNDHDLARIPTHQGRREFAESRDRTVSARSEWDLVDVDGPHPDVPTVVCRKHDVRLFDRDAFVAAGRRRTGRTIDINVGGVPH